jgi:uncharacterized protein
LATPRRARSGLQPDYLLDANTLIALCWGPHQHHNSMVNWFAKHAGRGWATCPLTQAAFVRVILQPTFSGRSLLAQEVFDLLAETTAHTYHHFLPIDFDTTAVRDVCTGGLLGHRQMTDGWLLTTAVRNNVKLLTFDQGIKSLLSTDRERAAHLEVLDKPAIVGLQ